ncbi:hypothetical protein BDZ91DRAFT_710371 [Kalaharituber pfeilii]|nr:hypothetical protein BDZ91DRAFT_710371 [Kalaharituber pfeilii]
MQQPFWQPFQQSFLMVISVAILTVVSPCFDNYLYPFKTTILTSSTVLCHEHTTRWSKKYWNG